MKLSEFVPSQWVKLVVDGTIASGVLNDDMNAEEHALAYAAQLKQERDTWKANHDNQVKLKAAIASRPDLGERAAKVEEMAGEIERLARERDGLVTSCNLRDAEVEGLMKRLADATAERDSLSRRVEALERQVEAMAQ